MFNPLNLFSKLIKSGNQNELNRIQKIIKEINLLEKDIEKLEDSEFPKKTNELMAHAYSNLYGLKTIGLRFFTVYGPWGRPDMALFIFTKAIIENKKIEVFNEGNHTRSFTYISDIVEPIHRLIKINESEQNILNSNEILNIGGAETVKLLRFIDIIEKYIGRKAKIILKPMQKGDVKETNADISKLERITKYVPQVNIEEGIKRFIDWYKKYHKII